MLARTLLALPVPEQSAPARWAAAAAYAAATRMAHWATTPALPLTPRCHSTTFLPMTMARWRWKWPISASLPAADGLHALLLGHAGRANIDLWHTATDAGRAFAPYTDRLESVYPVHAPTTGTHPTPDYCFLPHRPACAHRGQAGAPAGDYPGTSAPTASGTPRRPLLRAGADLQVLVLTNRTPQEVTQSPRCAGAGHPQQPDIDAAGRFLGGGDRA